MNWASYIPSICIRNIVSAMLLFASLAGYSQSSAYENGIAFSDKCMSLAVQGKKDSAVFFGKSAVKVFSEIDTAKAQLAKSYQRIGIAYSVVRAYDSSFIYNDSALKYAELALDSHTYAYTLRNQGINHHYSGNMSDAIDYYYRSLRFFEAIGNEKFSALLYLDLGNLFYEIQGYREAEEYFKQGISTIEACQCLEQQLAACYNGLGNALSGQDLESDSVLRIAARLQLDRGDTLSYGIVLNNLGNNFYHVRKQTDSAKVYFLKSLAIIEKYQAPHYLSGMLVNLGILYREENKTDSALYCLDKGIAQAAEFNQKNILRNGLFELVDYYKSLGDYKKALTLSDSANKLSIELLGEENLIAAELERIRFNVEKTERENENLRAENKASSAKIEQTKKWNRTLLYGFSIILILLAIILYNRRQLNKANLALSQNQYSLEQSNLKLEGLSNFQNKVISAVGHDLRGYLGNNEGLIDLLRTDENKELSSLLKSNNTSARDILINLVNWGQTHQDIKLELKQVELKSILTDTLEQVQVYFSSKEQQIDTEFNCESTCIASEQGLNLVLRNLLINASKYTPNQGKIAVSCHEKNGEITITVQNEGEHLTQELIDSILTGDQIKSTRGTNNEKGLGIGLQLVLYMLNEMNSKLNISNTENGPSFSFSLRTA